MNQKQRVEEFKRCINDLKFKGALIMGHPKNGFLDQEEYEPLFAAAEELNAPIYLHPSPIQSDVYQAYYKGNYPDVNSLHSLVSVMVGM